MLFSKTRKTYRGAQLIHNIRHIKPGMEFKVSRSIRSSGTHTAWQYIQFTCHIPSFFVIPEFSNEVLAKIRDVCDTSFKGIEDLFHNTKERGK